MHVESEYVSTSFSGYLYSDMSKYDLVDTGRKLNVYKTFRRRPWEDVLDVFWTSYVRSIYVLCLCGSTTKLFQTSARHLNWPHYYNPDLNTFRIQWRNISFKWRRQHSHSTKQLFEHGKSKYRFYKC